MPQLPFLVVHGVLVWKLVLVGLVAGTFGVLCWPLGNRRAVLGAALSVPLWYGALYAIGRHIEPRATSVLNPFGSVAVAAALPGSRPKALKALEEGIRESITRDDAGLRLGMELDRWSGECSARRLWDAKRLDEALVFARDCDPLLVPRLLAALGKYEEAATVVDPRLDDDLALAAYVASSRWADAAKVIGEQQWSEQQKVWADCLVSFLETRMGDRSALAKLAGESTPPCRLMHAIATDTLEPSPKYHDFDVKMLAAQLGAPEREWEQFRYYSAAYGDPRLPWLARFAIVKSADDARTQYFADGRARRDLLVGDLTAAHAEISTPAPREDYERMSSRHAVQAMLAILEGTALPPFEEPLNLDTLFRGERLLRGDMTVLSDVDLGDEHRCQRRTAASAALAGDGGPLSVLLATCPADLLWPIPEIGPALLGRVVTHRPELADLLRHFHGRLDAARPLVLVRDYAAYRDMARALGDSDEAHRWQVTIDRFAWMLADRDRATVFAILETMR